MTELTSKQNQSIYDVCLQAYGSIDFLPQLIADNEGLNFDSDINIGDTIIYDDTLGIKRINDKRDNEDVIYTNSDSIEPFEYLETTDNEPITTTDGEFILIA